MSGERTCTIIGVQSVNDSAQCWSQAHVAMTGIFRSRTSSSTSFDIGRISVSP